MTTQVAVLVPVLGRPERVAGVIRNVAETCAVARLLFIANESDGDEIAALHRAGAEVLVVPDARKSWACKINDGLRATTEPWIFTGADDLCFHRDWFERALEAAGPHVSVIGTNDIANHRVMCGLHSTHTLFRRDYVERFGTIDQPGLVMHEGYPHAFADDEAVATAMARGVYAHAFDAIVEHLHPMVGKAVDDATYRAGQKVSAQGQRLFVQRRKLWADAAGVKLAMVPVPQRAVVVTATYGGLDAQLHVPVPQDMPVEWVCFTDDPHLSVPAPWRVEVRPGRFGDDARMNAKVAKMCPEVGCDDVVWTDASHQVTHRSFVREALACRNDGAAFFAHPRRDCIYAELAALRGPEGQGRYADRPLDEQEAAYRAEGFPEHAGLYSGGTIAWDLRDERVKRLGAAWLEETARWSHHDQVELPVVLRRLGITPGVFPYPQIAAKGPKTRYISNRWLRIHPHRVQPAPVGVSVLLPFSSTDPDRLRSFAFVRSGYEAMGFEVVVGRCEDEWSKGRAAHDAFSRASHDLLVVADADCLIGEKTIRRALALVRQHGWCVPHARTWRLSRKVTEAVLEGQPPEPYGPVQNAVVGGGVVVLTRKAWETSGGIDPRFYGWGGEDISFGWALETLVGRGGRAHGDLFHLWHEPSPTRGSPESEILAGRYRRAVRKPQVMRELVAEARVAV